MYYSGRLSVSLIAFTLLVHSFHYFASYWGEDCLDYLKSTSSWIREGNGNPLHYSCLENLMDRGAWWGADHGVSMSQTQLSDFTFTFHFHALEKEMATHSRNLAWKIPWTEEPGRLQSMGSQELAMTYRLNHHHTLTIPPSLVQSFILQA